ncbi:MAG: hypothetical protein WKG00_01565 [Polyangiaceae bacterium]
MDLVRYALPSLLALSMPLLSACEGGASDAGLAPTATALAPSKPAAASARPMVIDKASSKLDFMMEAPVEKIRGRVVGATEGQIQVDPSDISKTTGFLAADISGIELYQQVQDDKTKEFGKEVKNDTQNEHARQWLEIGPDAPEDARKNNGRVEFAIRRIEGASQNDVSKMTGPTRKVTFKAVGDFLLHGRKTEKTAELEATFTYAGDEPTAVSVRTVKPFAVGLAEHDVRPRKGFGVLAEKGLELLAPKVAKEALVSVEVMARPGTMPAGSSAAAPGASGAPAASAAAAAASASSAGAK